MARIQPFQGIVYNPDAIGNLGDVTTPPYDVISEAEQDGYYQRHPHNIIRLDLGKISQGDDAQENRHTRAGAYLHQWLQEGVLVRDPAPALYLTEMVFHLNGKPVSRWGFVARVGLESFDKKVILPHETTFSRVKSERFELIKVCQANFSPIFSLYSDPENSLISRLRASVEESRPDMDFTDDRFQTHKVWKVTDPALHGFVSIFMRNRNLFIADGHHRYETALNYRNHMSSGTSDFPPDHPSQYVMMYLAAMEDPGLVILPAHRIIRGVTQDRIDRFLSRIPQYFAIEWIPKPENIRLLADRLQTVSEKTTVMGVCFSKQEKVLVLQVKPGVMKEVYGNSLTDNLLSLDVTVLTRLVLMDILGFGATDLDDENRIAYSSSMMDAVRFVRSIDDGMTFLLNPTRIDQVRRIAEAGEIMPRKSTYFYPKVITGLAINPLF